MKESQVITEFMKEVQSAASAQGEGFWYFKIPDMPYDGSNAPGHTRFNPGKAVDLVGGFSGGSFAIEWKLHKTTGAFAFNRVNERQEEFLQKVHFGGGAALIAITQFVKKEDMTNKYLEYVPDESLVRGNLWMTLLVPIDAWDHMKRMHPRKSIRLETIVRSDVFRINKVQIDGKSVWDGQAALEFIKDQGAR